MQNKGITDWLMEGDISIQYQTRRDLLGKDQPGLQRRIATEGWGKKLLDLRGPNGHWGQGFYQPKWTSSHYTLLDLKNLCLPRDNKAVKETIEKIIKEEKGPDGGIKPIGATQKSDVCINGMFLNYACYFGASALDLHSIVDFILQEKMPDGGFNCMSNRKGAHHSSMHTTLSVLEGILEFVKQGYTYRLKELMEARAGSHEFLLKHRLYLSDRTGAVIRESFLKLCYPGRWYYDILRALDYFRSSGMAYHTALEHALDVLIEKRTKDGRWKLPAHHPGKRHFDMEAVGQPCRWNTLRALRVLNHFGY